MIWNGKKLKSLLFRNGKLKGFSLAFAFGLWLFVNYGERDTEKTLLVPVELRNLPAQFIVTGPVVDYVDLRMRGPRSLLDGIRSKKIRLDLGEVRPGVASFRVNGDMLSLPRGVRVVRISPSQINLDVAQLLKRTVPVRLVLAGEPPHGYQVGTTEIVPSSVEVAGPALQVRGIKGVETVPLNIKDATVPITRKVSLHEPEEEFISYGTDQVQVKIGIQEVLQSRSFPQVEVTILAAKDEAKISPSRIDLIVRGPQRLVEKMTANDIVAFADTRDTTDANTLPVKIRLPDRVELVSSEPSEVQLQMAEEPPQLPISPEPKPQPKFRKKSNRK